MARFPSVTCLGAMFVSMLVLALTAAPAGAVIVYTCGPDNNLCRINSDGSHQAQLTSDATATANQYQSPSLSADGSKLAFIQGSSAYSSAQDTTGRVQLIPGDDVFTAMRPDGGRVAVIDEVNEGGSFLVPYLDEVNLDNTNSSADSRAVQTAGYLGNSILRDGYSATSHICNSGSGNCPAYSICEIDTQGRCTRNVADDPLRDLWGPAGSPDGTLVAAMAVSYPQGSAHPSPGGGDIALYDAATGAFVRNLTNGPNDSQPTWSPDGSQIAFTRGNAIYVIAVNGAPGSERLLTQGGSPTWGGPDISNGNGGQHTLTVSLAGNGKGTVSGSSITCPGGCTQSYAAGTSVTLSAAPAAGSTFSGWSGACAGTGVCTVAMTADRGVTATFALASTPARPSHTTLTKSAIRARGHTASFSFSAAGASAFQCELIPPHKKGHKKPKVRFSPCTSPKHYSHLKAGKYTFAVEGVNSEGADRHRASKTFKID